MKELEAATKIEEEAKKASAAASSNEDPEASGPTSREPESTEAMRRKCKNTLIASCTILAKPGFCSLIKLISLFLGPFYDQHTDNVTGVRSPEESLAFYCILPDYSYCVRSL